LLLSIHVTAHPYNLTIEYMRDPETSCITPTCHVLEECLKEKREQEDKGGEEREREREREKY